MSEKFKNFENWAPFLLTPIWYSRQKSLTYLLLNIFFLCLFDQVSATHQPSQWMLFPKVDGKLDSIMKRFDAAENRTLDSQFFRAPFSIFGLFFSTRSSCIQANIHSITLLGNVHLFRCHNSNRETASLYAK